VTISARHLYARALLLAALVLPLAGTSLHLQAQQKSPGYNSPGRESTPAANSVEKNQQEQDENDEYRKSPTVQAFGAKLGLNPSQAATAFTLVNFSLLAIGVLYALAKLLPKKFRERSSAIQRNLVDARTATQEATARLSSVEDRLGRLDEQIAVLKQQAVTDSANDEVRIKASVEEESKKIIAAAEQEIQSAATMARRDLQRYAAELAIEQASHRLTVNAETDRLLVQGFAQRLLDESKGGQN
jgi:F-type H+-transporting ATPase subunit b